MYVRIRGKPVGPLDDEKVQELIRQGKISKVSEVSSDGQQWVRASEFGLFAPKDMGDDLRLVDSPAPEPTRKKAKTLPGSIPIAEIDDENVEDCVWFYSADGHSGFGPLTRREIGLLIRKGTLTPDSLLWKQGEMADTVRYTPDFAEFLIPKQDETDSPQSPGSPTSLPIPPPAPTQETSRKSKAEKKESSPVLREQLIWEAARAAPWIMFLAIIASLGVAMVSLGLLGTICFWLTGLSWVYIVISVSLALGMIALMVRPLLMLWKLQTAISRLAVEQTDERLRDVLRRYYYIFRSLVVHILVFFLLCGVSFLFFMLALRRVLAVLQ